MPTIGQLARRSSLVGGCLLLLTAASWQKKQFSEWSTKDAQAVLTNSPWAKQVQLGGQSGGGAAGNAPANDGLPSASSSPSGGGGGSSPGSNPGYGQGVGGSRGSEGSGRPSPTGPGGGGGAPSQGPGADSSAGAPQGFGPTVSIVWASALPVKLAELKLKAAGNPPAPAEVEQARRPMDSYAIAVVGMPVPPDQVNSLASQATLQPKGKDPIRAAKAEVQKGTQPVMVFAFPKTQPITLDDREVQFAVRLGRIDVRRRFNLKDMQYQGKLEL